MVAVRGCLPGGTAQQADDSRKYIRQGLNRSESVCPLIDALPLGVVHAQVWGSCAVSIGQIIRAVSVFRGTRDAVLLCDAGCIAVHGAVSENIAGIEFSSLDQGEVVGSDIFLLARVALQGQVIHSLARQRLQAEEVNLL